MIRNLCRSGNLLRRQGYPNHILRICLLPLFRSVYISLIPYFIGILKIVTRLSVFVFDFNDFTFYDAFWNREYFFISYTGEYLIRTALFQSYKGYPFLFTYIKPDNVTIKRFWTFWLFRPHFCFACDEDTVP